MAWSAFGACSATCGTGTQTRTWTVSTPAANGGTECPAALSEDRNCNTNACPETDSPTPTDMDEPSESSSETASPTPTSTPTETSTSVESIAPVARRLSARWGTIAIMVRNPASAEYDVSSSGSSDCSQLYGGVITSAQSRSGVLMLDVDDLGRGMTICVRFGGAGGGETFKRLSMHVCPSNGDLHQCLSSTRAVPKHLQQCNRGGEKYRQLCWCYEGQPDIWCSFRYEEPWTGEGPSSVEDWRAMLRKYR
eukprot:NODE_2286_length_1241_cov_21.778523_g2082_i0.p1 GENE.NODE_2286_length_1241_cov_21.778523_g2082_i0~~NODE_2286_length_1241_cov_21.778523_g2082_i0.p1  ORF type:complete len:251 (-),score=28.57 NODE_2286_length_1241_cov_21.778523_g2082_i0:143-895(-)